MRAQFQQLLAEPAHLGAGARGARRAQPEFLHQDVGGGGDEDAELSDPKARAARAVDLPAVKFLDCWA
jgi:hypothetical protein